MALRAWNASPSGRATFEPQEHVPRTSPRAQTCARGPGGLPACHGAESTRKDPQPEEQKMSKGQKNTYMYGSYIHQLRVLPRSILNVASYVLRSRVMKDWKVFRQVVRYVVLPANVASGNTRGPAQDGGLGFTSAVSLDRTRLVNITSSLHAFYS